MAIREVEEEQVIQWEQTIQTLTAETASLKNQITTLQAQLSEAETPKEIKELQAALTQAAADLSAAQLEMKEAVTSLKAAQQTPPTPSQLESAREEGRAEVRTAQKDQRSLAERKAWF